LSEVFAAYGSSPYRWSASGWVLLGLSSFRRSARTSGSRCITGHRHRKTSHKEVLNARHNARYAWQEGTESRHLASVISATTATHALVSSLTLTVIGFGFVL
jgi:hypothetical protein